MNEAWVKDEKGDIVVFPLVCYETMVVESKALALRLPFMMRGDTQERPSGNLQLIVTADGARELAKDILAAVEKIERAQAAKTH